MSVEGELDDISGAGQTAAVHDICSGVPKSQQRHFEAKGAGHYGIFSAAAGASMCTRRSRPSSSRAPVAKRPAAGFSQSTSCRQARFS